MHTCFICSRFYEEGRTNCTHFSKNSYVDPQEQLSEISPLCVLLMLSGSWFKLTSCHCLTTRLTDKATGPLFVACGLNLLARPSNGGSFGISLTFLLGDLFAADLTDWLDGWMDASLGSSGSRTKAARVSQQPLGRAEVNC